MARQNIERQKELEPQRIAKAKQEIENRGYVITFEDEIQLRFMHNDCMIIFYPYSGWHTGKSIKDGRGLQNLLKQLK